MEHRISGKAFIGHYLAAGLAAVVLGAVLISTGNPGFSPLVLLLPAGVFAYAKLLQIGTAYRLHPDRLEVESGIVTRKIENVELFRIRDVGLRQGLIGRLADVGDIYLHSTDSSTPDLHIRGVQAPRSLYEDLRDRIAASRASARTMIVEQGSPISEP